MTDSIKPITGGDAFLTRDLDESMEDTKDFSQISNIVQGTPLTRQPLKGKDEKLRLGELERDAILEYGANVYSRNK